MTPSPSRLIVASNRLPVVVSADGPGKWHIEPAVGGLVTALLPVLRSLGGTWVGWPGIAGAGDEAIDRALDDFTRDDGYRFATVPLTTADVRGFYRGFANEIVWPLFHDLFGNCVFEPRYWRSYERANRRFAEVIAGHARPGDVVWVQDYHLMNVAESLRAMGLDNRIGFFLHVPFPSPDIFLKLPWREHIMRGLLSFNQIGFQTERDQENFLACAERLAGPLKRSLDVSGICLRPGANGTPELVVGTFPISIDFEEFSERSRSDRVTDLMDLLRREFRDRLLIMGVDRLDYSKGLPLKLAAFRLLLERNRDLHRRVSLVQHVVPSRESVPDYQRQRLEIEGLVGEINGAYSEPGWVPIHYYYHTLDPQTLAAWYRAADVALITPLKDGMNLVVKEYCACHNDERGVVVLSEFAGAAAELGAHALLVNPFDVEGVAGALRRACLMDEPEQRRRMQALRTIVRENDVHRWAGRCLAASSQGHCRPRPVAGRSAATGANPEPVARDALSA